MTKWNNPHEWLREKISQWDEHTLRRELFNILPILTADQIQDEFQNWMDEDGYFAEDTDA